MEDSVDQELSWDNLFYIADFFESSGVRHISLLGGEPTLHSNFVQYVTYLLQRNFHVTVFTSAIMSTDKLYQLEQHLKQYGPNQLSFVCNLNEPSISSDEENQKQIKFLKTFGPYTTASFNIYQLDFDLNFLADYIVKYKMNRSIRFGLAHPIPGQENVCIVPEDMPELSKRLFSFAPLLEKENISPNFDCGMPLCIFNDEQLGRLFRMTKGELRFGCGPAIDIGPDMSVWSCFPLHALEKKSLFEFDKFDDIAKYFSEYLGELKKDKNSGIFSECSTCKELINNKCSGGCVAHYLSSNPQVLTGKKRKSTA